MGKSHYKSDIIGYDGTQKIASINKIDISATITGAVVQSTGPVISANYIKIGTKYIFTTSFSTAASINAEATALAGTAAQGSIALGKGEFWIFASDNSATMFAQP